MVRISVVADREGWRDSRVQHVFATTQSCRKIARGGYVEASRLCFARQVRRGAFLQVVAHLAAMASFHQADWLVACPRVEHADSYRRMFGFKSIAPPRRYYGVAFDTPLLAISREDIGDDVREAPPMKKAWSTALEHLTRSATCA